MKKLPAIFFGHGSPMNAIEENSYTKTWQEIVKTFPKPKAIISISAHWETAGSKVTTNHKQKTIHDFYGFPQELFDVEYSPNGDEKLAEKIQKLIPEIALDSGWGLDHGTWSVLRKIYPEADIPTIQLSLDKNKTPQQHYEFAKQLRSLRDEEILIIGSGNIVHNLSRINWRNDEPYSWGIKFNEAITKAVISEDHETILNYKKLDGSRESVPTPEHFLPLIYIIGLQENDEKISTFNNQIALSSIAMTGFAVGAKGG